MSNLEPEAARPRRGVEVYVLSVLVVLGAISIIGLVGLRTIYRPFSIPSGSMEPTLRIGDYMLTTLTTADKARRGDVLVFKDPKDSGYDIVKRLIGLRGDEVQMVDGFLYLCGALVPQEQMDRPKDQDPYSDVTDSRERLPEGRVYVIRSEFNDGQLDNTGVFVVPAGHYFFLGDNRDNAADSRVKMALGGIEYVPAANIFAKATTVVFSTKGARGRWFKKVE